MSAIDDDLVTILQCPISTKAVRRMTREELEKVNSLILVGLVECADTHNPAPLREALITVDHKRIYPIRNGVVVMQFRESIEANQIPGLF